MFADVEFDSAISCFIAVFGDGKIVNLTANTLAAAKSEANRMTVDIEQEFLIEDDGA